MMSLVVLLKQYNTQSGIHCISRNIKALSFKLGIRNVHHKGNKMQNGDI